MTELPSKLNIIEPIAEAPFEGDMLDRAKYTYVLRGIVDTYANEGCVLSINGDWGTGKTTFVKMWRMEMEKFSYRTIYFNAWENDYISDPLIAIMGELKDILGDNDKYNSVISKVARIVSGIGFAVAEAAVKQTTGVSAEVLQGAINATDSIVLESIKEYGEQKGSLLEFKKVLSEYVADVREGQKYPLIFIIDELDRCNPHYAVKVLERIKHLFDIPNIIFVLPISKSQLECSIKGFYGSENIDASNYLRRFIDLEYELPQPNIEKFCDHLFEHYGFEEVFKNTNYHDRQSDNIENFKGCVKRLFTRTGIDLRTLDKIYSRTRLVVQTTNGQYNTQLDVIFFLCYLRTLYFDIYDNMRSHKYTLQELVSTIERIFPRPLMDHQSCDNFDAHGFTYTIADILYAYNIAPGGEHEPGVLPKSNEEPLNLKLNVFTSDQLHDALIYTHRNPHSRMNYFSNTFQIIDLLNGLR